MDIAYLLRRAAREFPTIPAVDDGRQQRTLGELVARAERLANAFDSLGVPEGGSVGVLSENRTEYVEADVAIALGRRTRVALNARLHLDDHRYVAQDADMRVLLHSQEHAETAAALGEELGVSTICFDRDGGVGRWYGTLIDDASPEVRRRSDDPEAPLWITYTSGTTGRPKGVVLSHRSLREVAFNLLLEFGPVEPGEQIVLTQALSHGAGYFVLPYLLRGAGVYVSRRFDPEEVWAVAARDNIRTLKAVPAMLPPLLEHTRRDWGYESIIYGASPIPLPVLEASVERFGPTLQQLYGQTEAPMTISCLHKQDHLLEEPRLSAGRPWRTVAVEIRDEGGRVEPGSIGEIHVRGPHLMTEYHRKPDATAEVFVDGWIATKDMARADDRGFIYLQGRRDEMINSGGYNIAPREVEDVLVAHRGVEEVVVLGLPDPRWGQVVTAVVRHGRGGAPDAEELIEFARPRLGIRAPKRIIVRSEIPRTPYGKVDRAALRTDLEGGQPTPEPASSRQERA
jgi:fatty-acyl-CoA synthase